MEARAGRRNESAASRKSFFIRSPDIQWTMVSPPSGLHPKTPLFGDHTVKGAERDVRLSD
jgi:hypothetical protein